MAKYLESDQHPMEIEAELMSEKDGPECLRYLESLYKNTDYITTFHDNENIYSHNNIIADNDNSSSLNN
jgi:hypothetical protein